MYNRIEIEFWIDGAGEKIWEMALYGASPEGEEWWQEFKDALIEEHKLTLKYCESIGHPNTNIEINFLDDENHKVAFLVVYNGVVELDIMEIVE